MQEPDLDGAKHPQLPPGKGRASRGWPGNTPAQYLGGGQEQDVPLSVLGGWQWHTAIGAGAGMPAMQNHPRLPRTQGMLIERVLLSGFGWGEVLVYLTGTTNLPIYPAVFSPCLGSQQGRR